MGRAVVPVAGEGVPAGEGLLVSENQRLVAGPELDLMQGGLAAEVDAARVHEPHGPVDLAGDGFVAPARVAGGDELLVPHVDLRQIGETPGREGPDQVEGRRRLVIGGQEAGRVRGSGLEGRGVVVDDVAPEAREGDVADPLRRRGSGLGELAGDAAQLDHRDPGAVDQDDGHLEDDLQLVPDGVGGEVGEGLGAVARLEEKGPAVGDLGQGGPKPAGLSGEDQRGQDRQGLEGRLQVGRVGPLRLLGGGQVPPRARGPGLVHPYRVVGRREKHNADMPEGLRTRRICQRGSRRPGSIGSVAVGQDADQTRGT